MTPRLRRKPPGRQSAKKDGVEHLIHKKDGSIGERKLLRTILTHLARVAFDLTKAVRLA